MANEVKLPRLGQGMEAGTIIKWLKSEGDEVEKGEPLYELDTDKVTQEVEADFSGVLLKIAVAEGEVPVGQTIAVIGEQGEDVQVTEPEEAPEEPKEEPKREERPAPAAEARQPARTDGRVKASPLARRIARERGIDLAALSGTGPEGRIVAEDVERAEVGAAPAAAPAAAPTEVERVPLTSIRKTIARRLTEAWEAPVFQLGMTANMTNALAVRERLVELHPEQKPTISDLLTKLAASALMRHRELNATFVEDEIQLHPTANVGIAVATERGLVVPVHRSAERKTIAEIAAERADLVSRAREGKLQQADLDGGTFTISNLGMFGIERFIAVLNPPQVAIVAVGAIAEQAVVEGGEVVVQPRMELTLTCDHRAVDGAVGAEFLRTLKELVEQPALAL